jgi:uncharacterized membrane protein
MTHKLLWLALIPLIVIGVLASAIRVASTDYVTTKGIAIRQQALTSMGIDDPIAAQRAAQTMAFERKLAEYRGATLLHVIPGALFLIFGSLQLVKWIRQRNITLHRWNGRVMLALALLSIIPGLFFGLFMPAGGRAEAVIIGFFGALFLTALVKGFIAIRRRQVGVHREWMLRAYAVAIGISMSRVLGAPVDFFFTPFGLSTPAIFAIDLALAFSSTTIVAEIWIRRTRPRARPIPALSPATV